MQRTAKSRTKSARAVLERAPSAGFDLFAALSLFALAVLLLSPVFLYSFPNGDDAAQHYWWLKEFASEINDGVIYPRWLSGAYEGRGSPVMLYYPPLPFYVATIIYSISGEPLGALALGYLAGLALSGLTMYIFSKRLLSQKESLVAAGFYMAAHYHLFDFYQRAAQHEFWAMTWAPLLFYGIYRAGTEDGSRAVVIVALGYFLLLVTHLPTSLMATIVLPFYALLLSRDARRLTRAAAGLAVGAGMAALSIFPYLLEKDYLKPLGEKTEIQRYYSGFLLENLGAASSQVPLPSSGNFHLFVLAGDWMAAGLLLLLAVCAWITWKSEYGRNRLVRAIWAVTTLSFLFTTRITWPVWQAVPRFKHLQFPIRWFAITSLGASLLVAVAFAIIAQRGKSSFQSYALAAAVILNLAISALVVARAPYQPEALQARLQRYTDVREYHPKWWDQQRHAEFEAVPVVVDKGKADIRAIDDTGTSQSYVVNADRDSSLRLRTLYFPGWVARLDGQPARISPGHDGHIRLETGPGEHTLTLTFEDTAARAAGKVVSAISVFAFAVMLYIARRGATTPDQPRLKAVNRIARKRPR